MIKPVVTEIREIYSDLSQEFHSVFVPITAEAGLGTYVVVDFIFEFLDRCRMFDITVQDFPVINTIGKEAVSVPLSFCYWGFWNELA